MERNGKFWSLLICGEIYVMYYPLTALVLQTHFGWLVVVVVRMISYGIRWDTKVIVGNYCWMLSLAFALPWYNRHGWLGVKKQFPSFLHWWCCLATYVISEEVLAPQDNALIESEGSCWAVLDVSFDSFQAWGCQQSLGSLPRQNVLWDQDQGHITRGNQ